MKIWFSKLLFRFRLIFFVIPLIIMIFGCTRYATKEEILELEKVQKELHMLEKEVKELKEYQIEIVNLKSKILKELNDCKNSESSLEHKNKSLETNSRK